MRRAWKIVVRTLGGIVLTLALLTGLGASLFHLGRALAETNARAADMPAAGADPMPVGTVEPVSRLDRLRPRKS